ncbi:hypothetical protein QBC43DRAFT_315519 [Cladorrhinum sp. PSN259]|nr:hypothetical protein QBC43DRAFT_315519 [Cladorrhinum sp. PSN259]
MSGFEIAGIVLGAFPILISALDGYRDVAKTVGLWYNIRPEYQKCRNEVNAQRVAFIGNLKRLLLSLEIDDAKLSRMLAVPGGDEWNDPAVTHHLQARLRDSFDVFFNTIQDMEKSAAELHKEMAMDPDRLQQKVILSKSSELKVHLKRALEKSNAIREYHLYRLQFSMGEATRKALFESMQRYNDRLQNILETCDAVSQAQHSREFTKRSKTRSAICGFWKHADRLYKTICKAWNCSCWQEHHAHLLLQDNQAVRPSFELLFSSSIPHLPVDPASKEWVSCCRVELDPKQKVSIPIRLPVPVQARPSTPQHRTAIPQRPSILSRGKSHTVPIRRTAGAPSVTITVGEFKEANAEKEVEEIMSLCTSFQHQSTNPVSPKDCQGYIQMDDERYYLYPAQPGGISGTSQQNSPISTVTLGTLLHGDGSHRPLTRRQRYSLALTVASSFLQLSGSPWIDSPLTKSDLVFLTDPGNTDKVLLEHPFVGRHFASFRGNNSPPLDADQAILGFESLGIVLLELCFGKPIEAHPSRLRISGPATGTVPSSAVAGFNLLVALEWLKDVTEEAGMDYSEAVAWCLVGGRTIPPGDGWRAVMLERVVKPLGDCYSCIC